MIFPKLRLFHRLLASVLLVAGLCCAGTATAFVKKETVTRSYDARDWLWKTTDTRGKYSRTEYFADGRVQRTYDPLNRQRSDLTYNTNGQSWDTKTPMPHAGGGWATTTNTYTARGELWKATDAFGYTEFTNDENGNVWKRRDRRGKTWRFTYNDDNQIEDTISPETARRWERRYDTRGLLHTLKEPSGQVTAYWPDAVGRVGLAVNDLGSITYSYDDKGRPDTVQESAAGSPLIDRRPSSG